MHPLNIHRSARDAQIEYLKQQLPLTDDLYEHMLEQAKSLVESGQGDLLLIDAIDELEPGEFAGGIKFFLDNCDLGCHRKKMAALSTR